MTPAPTQFNAEAFNALFNVDLRDKTETKEVDGKSLSYVSWAYAWAEACRRFDDISFVVHEDEAHNQFFGSGRFGYYVKTSVTINGTTRTLSLPVLDSKNKVMRDVEYTYKTKYGEKTVAPMDIFAVNKSIMRCLVKTLALFGLGLYVFAGEDLPEAQNPQIKKPLGVKEREAIAAATTTEKLKDVCAFLKSCGFDVHETLAAFHARLAEIEIAAKRAEKKAAKTAAETETKND